MSLGVRGLDLVQVGEQLVQGGRRGGDAGLAEQILAVDHHPAAGVVRNRLQLAVRRGAGVGQALEPAAGVLELALARGQVGERAAGDVGGGLGVAQLDHVRHAGAAGERGVQLGGVVRPLLPLHVHLRAGGLLEPLVGLVDDRRPALLRVALQPHGDGLALAVGGQDAAALRGAGRRLAGAAARTERQRHGRGRDYRTRESAIHATVSFKIGIDELRLSIGLDHCAVKSLPRPAGGRYPTDTDRS